MNERQRLLSSASRKKDLAADNQASIGKGIAGNRKKSTAEINRFWQRKRYKDAYKKARKGYRKLLLPDIIIKCVGLVLALAVYPPIMMYSVLIAAAYIITLKAVIDRKAKRKLEEICLWTKKEYVVELKA